MSDSYTLFVSAAYGVSALSLVFLGGWIAVDARRTRAKLASLEARVKRTRGRS